MKWFSGKFRLVIISLALSLFILAAKFFAYLLTHSNIILTDALESIINVVTSGFASFSIYLASQPRDENHPYGHGKIEFFSAGIEGLLILIAGILIFIKAIYNFFVPPTMQALDVGIIILGATAVINFVWGRYLVKQGSKEASLTLVAEGRHLLTDNITTLVGIVGVLVVIFTQDALMDTVFSLFLSLYIIRSGYRLIRPSVAGLMDETDTELIKRISEILNRNREDDWIDIHNMRVVKYGADIHIDCHVSIPYYYSLLKSHEVVIAVENTLRKEYPRSVEIFIHADPCEPERKQCRICPVQNCEVRRYPFEQRVFWTPELLMKNRKHGVD